MRLHDCACGAVLTVAWTWTVIACGVCGKRIDLREDAEIVVEK